MTDKEKKDALLGVAVEVLLERIKRTRRRVIASRIFAWTTIASLVVFGAVIIGTEGDPALTTFLVVVAAFGVIQAVRILRIAAGQKLAIEVFQNSLKESYERLTK